MPPPARLAPELIAQDVLASPVLVEIAVEELLLRASGADEVDREERIGEARENARRSGDLAWRAREQDRPSSFQNLAHALQEVRRDRGPDVLRPAKPRQRVFVFRDFTAAPEALVKRRTAHGAATGKDFTGENRERTAG